MTPVKEELLAPEMWGRVYRAPVGWVVMVVGTGSLHPIHLNCHTTEDSAIDELQSIIVRWKEPTEGVKSEV